MPVVKWRCARDALPHTFYISVLKSGENNYTTKKHIFTMNLRISLSVTAGGFFEVVAAFNHVGGSFNRSMATTADVWIIPSFQIWGHMLHVDHISCVITNCGHPFSSLDNSFGRTGGNISSTSVVSFHVGVVLAPSISTRKLLNLFQVAFLIFLAITTLSPYFLQFGLLLQFLALF